MYISVELLAPRTNCHVDNKRDVEKVLRSDREQFSEELAAAGESSKRDVVEKHRFFVDERTKVGGYKSIHPNSVNLSFLQFSGAMLLLGRVAEQAKEDARADVQMRRIERCVVGVYPDEYSQTLCRIWEKLSEEGWHEEIATRKSMYEPGLMEIAGVAMIRPLSKKGMHVPES